MTDYSYIGTGKVYVKVKGAAAGLKEVGNVSRLSFAITEETKELKDFTQPGGGTYNEVRRVSSVEATMVLHDLSPENLARALFGEVDAVSAGSVTDEVVTGYHDSLVKLAKVPSGSIVVTDSAGTTTYVADTDYEVRAGGIFILSTGAITDGQSLKVDYAYATQNNVEALVASAQDYELLFDGLNEARSGKKVRVEIHRMKIGAARELGLIQEDHAGLEVSGKLQKDTGITGTGISQYFKTVLVA